MRIAIYCGSASGRDPIYIETAREVARELHRRKLGVVYGGASVGTMGALADESVKLGNEIIGVLPRRLQAREMGHQGLTQLHIVEDMHQRKMMMMNLADGFITLKDRSKDLLISGGSNIYPREVEEVLLTAPGVAEASVTRPSARKENDGLATSAAKGSPTTQISARIRISNILAHPANAVS